jgi:hypothetical protein
LEDASQKISQTLARKSDKEVSCLLFCVATFVNAPQTYEAKNVAVSDGQWHEQ